MIDNVWKPSRKGKGIICIVLFAILMLNINTTNKQGISVLNHQLAPLKKLFLNIKIKIKDGTLNKDNRLYLSDDIARKLPLLCWNKAMGERFIKRGTYQWVFSRREIDYFSFTAEGAKWIIEAKDLQLVRKSPKINENSK